MFNKKKIKVDWESAKNFSKEFKSEEVISDLTSAMQYKIKECPHLYVIYDRVERKYSFPFSANTDAGAVRRMKNSGIFKDVSQNDFELYFIGYFDESGRDGLVFVDVPKVLVDWNLDVKDGVNE